MRLLLFRPSRAPSFERRQSGEAYPVSTAGRKDRQEGQGQVEDMGVLVINKDLVWALGVAWRFRSASVVQP